MKQHFTFDWGRTGGPGILLASGLKGYATNRRDVGGITTFWCFLGNGSTWRLECVMNDLGDWEEVGSLVFWDASEEMTLPEMLPLPPQWAQIESIDKLVVQVDEFCADSGLVLTNRAGDELTIVCGANVCAMAVRAPFFEGEFFPEFAMERYQRVPMM
ncbi:hypothetical protein [Massilia rubra]|uniref:Uncharacterized protein n=1 Tax=Massilia rubra TaxID=2607910 RepID=A0ABX0LH63_9BURK|nr:hypothetical protein [Massilia rubra]NHZ31998.1 hypothetical protein [Massilia rubra]